MAIPCLTKPGLCTGARSGGPAGKVRGPLKRFSEQTERVGRELVRCSDQGVGRLKALFAIGVPEKWEAESRFFQSRPRELRLLPDLLLAWPSSITAACIF